MAATLPARIRRMASSGPDAELRRIAPDHPICLIAD
jgi:hypothetical protein